MSRFVSSPRCWRWALLCALLLPVACERHRAPAGQIALVTPVAHCVTSADGYLRSRLRGALDEDVNWHDADMQCEGGPRPANHGVRVAFAGPGPHAGQRLRFVFGIDGVSENQSGHNLPTNLTVILEGPTQLFSTRGSDKCSIDELTQSALTSSNALRRYRVRARGFCVGPARDPQGGADVVLSRFDFAGLIVFGDS